MAGDECGRKLRSFFFQNAERRDGNGEDRGLRNLSELELVFRTLEAKLRKFVAERGVGFIEGLPGDGIFLGEFFPHADGLGALPGKEEHYAWRVGFVRTLDIGQQQVRNQPRLEPGGMARTSRASI